MSTKNFTFRILLTLVLAFTMSLAINEAKAQTEYDADVYVFGYGICDIEIFDVMGRKVQSFEFNVQSSETRNYEVEQFPSFGGVRGGLNISHLQNGIYFLRITTENGVVTKKIIKN